MDLAWEKLIVALDLDDRTEMENIVKALAPNGVKFKVGLRSFTKYGPEFVKWCIDNGGDVFLDLKLHDIPNTMKQAAAVIAEMGCWAFTVHLKAGEEALTEVKNEVIKVASDCGKKMPIILGVSELTSSNASLEDVLKLVDLADKVGIDVVCSAKEAKAIREKYSEIKIVTPGIRSPHDAVGDQKRVMTAKQAFKEGASFIVVGRPIIAKKDYLKAAETVLSY